MALGTSDKMSRSSIPQEERKERQNERSGSYLQQVSDMVTVCSIEASLLCKGYIPLSFLAIRLREYPVSGFTNILTTTDPSFWRPRIVFMNLALPRLSLSDENSIVGHVRADIPRPVDQLRRPTIHAVSNTEGCACLLS